MANGTLAASQIEMLSQSGTGIITITPPATNTNRAITLPDAAGAIVVSGTTPSLNGITFPATQVPSADANTLDDYEEGTWTPALVSGANSYGFQIGKYVKIGKSVTLIGSVNVSSRTASANTLVISGLPFSSDNTASSYVPVSLFPVLGFSKSTATSYVGQLGFNVTSFMMYGVVTSSGNNFLTMTMNDTGSAIEVEFAVTYICTT